MSSEDNRNLIVALVLAVGVYFMYQTFIVAPTLEEQQRQAATQSEKTPAKSGTPQPAATDDSGIPRPDVSRAAPAESPSRPDSGAALLDREDALSRSPRVPIRSDAVVGSIALKGGMIDDLKLSRYHETVDKTSPIITLLSPLKARGGYAAKFGWVAGGGMALPGDDTVWRQVGDGALTPSNPVTLQWDNGQGLMFERKISIDQNYMFTVTDRVVNSADNAVTLFPYGVIERHEVSDEPGFGILHIGFTGALDDEVRRKTFKDIRKAEDQKFKLESTGGWVGITDKYWLTALAPTDQGQIMNGRFMSRKNSRTGRDAFQADYVLNGKTVQPGKDLAVSTQFFAGAKKVRLIEAYQKEYGIAKFDYAVDWGWISFLSRPFFAALDWIAKHVGNFGVAILIFTVLVKICFFWFSQKSYVSMAKMKKVQPEMKKLQERYKDDKVKLQQEMLALYQKEKINPLAGCLPILIQFPVFIALYQVLFVTIEMRHAPFFGWIQDLSAPDPTSVFNLFGLLPYDPSQVPMIGDFLTLGAWPLIMGISMWLQMKMNPPPPDPTQQRIFGLMPIIFTFILAGFAAGLVIYWAWNNMLSIGQQYIIMRRMGVRPEWGNNIKLPGFIRRLTGGKEESSAQGDGAVTRAARGSSDKDER